jgi:hypothetical protein
MPSAIWPINSTACRVTPIVVGACKRRHETLRLAPLPARG